MGRGPGDDHDVHEERVRFCVEHAVGPYDEALVRLLLEGLVRGPEGVFDRTDGAARLTAALVEGAENASAAADLALLAARPDSADPGALRSLMATTVRDAFALARTGPCSVLQVSLRPSVAALQPALEGFARAHTTFQMATRDAATLPVVVPTGTVLRGATLDDADALRALTVAAFAGIPGAFVPDPEAYRAQLRRNLDHITVLEGSGRLLGLCRVRPMGPVGFVGLLARAPEARGRGLGEVLLREAMRRLRASGAERFQLDVVASNASALTLYERHGFRVTGEEVTWERSLRQP